MMQLLTISALLSGGLVMVASDGDFGPGIWNLKYINKCEEDKHMFKFDIQKNKINRTHDGIDASVVLEEDFTDQFGIRVDICKDVDGGCKPYQMITDDSFVKFAYKHAEGNVKTCLRMANVDPPDFPISAGKYDVKDFMFNYEELPSEAPYGEYAARACMLRGPEEVGCVEVYVEFLKEDDENCEEK